MANTREVTAPNPQGRPKTTNVNSGTSATQKARTDIRPKTTGKSLKDFGKLEGKKIRYVAKNYKGASTIWIPATYTVRTETGNQEVIYSQGSREIFISEFNVDYFKDKEAIRKTPIVMKNGMLVVDGEDALLQWYLYEITSNGIGDNGKPYDKIYIEDLEKEADEEIRNFEIDIDNKNAIMEMEYSRAAALVRAVSQERSFGAISPPVANEPLKAFKARLFKASQTNPQRFKEYMRDESVDLKHFCAVGIEKGVVTVKGDTILINGTAVCVKPGSMSPNEALYKELTQDEKAMSMWYDTLKENAEK